jgi:hypothetical protein
MELDRISDLHAAVSQAVSESMDDTIVAETMTVASSQQAGVGVARLKAEFDEDAYWQPVLKEGSVVPLPYRQDAGEDLLHLLQQQQQVLLVQLYIELLRVPLLYK